jgi:hypothetical protein
VDGHQLVPSIKQHIVDRFPIFVRGTGRPVELHQLALELEEGGIVARRVVFWQSSSLIAIIHEGTIPGWPILISAARGGELRKAQGTEAHR